MERWRPVVGFEGQYEVSDHGRVRSLDRILVSQRICHYSGRLLTIHRRHKGRVLRPGRMPCGHLSVALGKGNSICVHVLVLEAFSGPKPTPAHEALHWDDDGSNNHLDNLRWGTRSQNLLDAVRTKRKPVGERWHISKLKDADIPVIRALFGRVSYAELGRRYGVSESTIRQIKNRRAWTHIPESVYAEN